MKTVSGKSSSSLTGYHFAGMVLTPSFCVVLNTGESSDGGKVDTCGEKRGVSEESGGPSSWEESKTTVRERPTVPHKRGRLWANGTVHHSSYTICEKTSTLKRSNTSKQRSATGCSGAQGQNPEVQRSTDAEPRRTKLSALYQSVCGAIQ